MKTPLMCKLKAIFLKPKFDKICQKNEFPPLLLLGMKFQGFSESTFPKMLLAIHSDNILHNFGMDFGDVGAHKIFVFLCKSRVYIVCNMFMIFLKMFKHFIIVSRNIYIITKLLCRFSSSLLQILRFFSHLLAMDTTFIGKALHI